MNRPLLLFYCLACPLLASCGLPPAREAWDSVLSKCTESETIPTKHVVYLGPSNRIGPGSIWTEKGRYRPEWLLEDLINASRGLLSEESVLILGGEADCSGGVTTSWELSASVLLEEQTGTEESKLQADLEAELDTATEISIAITTWKHDQLKRGLYRDWLRSADASTIRDSLFSDPEAQVLIMDSAILVSGFKATITLDQAAKARLEKDYDPEKLARLKVAGKFTANWTQEGNLELSSEKDFYIGGTFASLKSDGTLAMLDTGGDNLNPFGDWILVPESICFEPRPER